MCFSQEQSKTDGLELRKLEHLSRSAVFRKKQVAFTLTFFFIVSAPRATVLIEVSIMILSFFNSMAYLIVIGQLTPMLFSGFVEPGSVLESKFLWITVSMFILSPLCFMKRLENLKFTSLLGLLSVLYLGVLVVSYYVYGPVAEHIEQVGKPADLFSTIPMLVFAFFCQSNVHFSHETRLL